MAKKPDMLIVDDEPNVCLTLKLIFEQEGFIVKTAASAKDGIHLLQNGRHFDLVLTDLHMEREDVGLDLARAAKRLHPAPVLVILTGYASMKNARIALDIHVDHFALKPIELPELLEAVRRLVGWRSDAHGLGD
ncbi:MAG TPA: response regulator [Candidatus Limnocylindrales bacterium]|jgi:CheY-like chemotaxis protein|nr:response regulator [Candidatus Limnocylindrales bacterium]